MKFCEHCDKYPVFGRDKLTGIGYCKSCQWKRTDLSKLSITAKAIQKHKEQKKRKPGWFQLEEDEIEVVSENDKLWEWFEYQRTKMTGFCHHCQRPSCKNDDKRFHYSLHHILEKSLFPSVATHESNVLELCFWGEGSCHTRADNKILQLSDMACWDEIISKFIDMYPSIAKQERRRIPEILMQYVDVEL